MDDLRIILTLPRECEILELNYRLTRPSTTHLDMTIASDGKERCLRFRGPRVVQFDKEMPDVLRGLEVKDIRDQKLAGLDLWVSVAGGAVTFWAKGLVELSSRTLEVEPQVPAFDSDQVKPWDLVGVPVESFVYRSPARASSTLRVFSISTRAYSRN